MKDGKQSVEVYYLNDAVELIEQTKNHINKAIDSLRLPQFKQAYQTPQWHHTVLWAGFAFVVGMMLGAGLMAG